jgi:F420-dependent oxidoreductase-like protein
VRFAFRTAPQNTTWTDLLAVWQAADDIEVFESGWLFDHFQPIFSDSRGPCLEGWTTMTALAQSTTRLRFGTLVTGIHHRHPAVLANMATALDIISGGRLELGVGAGWNEEEATAYGLALGTLAQRSDRLEEACEVLVGLLTQESTTFTGTHYRLRDARNEPKGVQRPHPPICIGGNGERRTLRTAARFAQHWSFFGGTPSDFVRKRDVLHGHCRDLGRDPSEILLSSPVVHDGDVAATAAAAAAMGQAGAHLAIVVLRPPFDPAALEPLATALSGIG